MGPFWVGTPTCPSVSNGFSPFLDPLSPGLALAAVLAPLLWASSDAAADSAGVLTAAEPAGGSPDAAGLKSSWEHSCASDSAVTLPASSSALAFAFFFLRRFFPVAAALPLQTRVTCQVLQHL